MNPMTLFSSRFFIYWLNLINGNVELTSSNSSPIQNYLANLTQIIELERVNQDINNFREYVQGGIDLHDLEFFLWSVIFFRIIILTIRYDLISAFAITIISGLAGYLWYRRFITVLTNYRSALLLIPFLDRLGMSAVHLNSLMEYEVVLNVQFGGVDAHWYQPGKILYHAFVSGIKAYNPNGPDSGIYYIDPISMMVTKLPESVKLKIEPIYYSIYNNVIPQIYFTCRKFWNQISALAAYTVIVRMGKKYCPYLIRWHWTFLIILSLTERNLPQLLNRLDYYQADVLGIKISNIVDDPQIIAPPRELSTLLFEYNLCTIIIQSIIVFHLGFLLFGLLHAICGQYFYIPFLVENTELHIGPRPKSSIYSGGNTAWQDKNQKNTGYTIKFHKKELFTIPGFPKLWFGWFGGGTPTETRLKKFIKLLIKLIKRLIKELIKLIKRIKD
uniref:Hypothetical chloroplast RF90 n=1 Tax=Climaconeis cf. scalaris TaxID=2846828 RepID=A0A8F8X8D1_9STRA|nr:hypothetical chloroplast RF90 [Climaconeis cf. scalaris]